MRKKTTRKTTSTRTASRRAPRASTRRTTTTPRRRRAKKQFSFPSFSLPFEIRPSYAILGIGAFCILLRFVSPVSIQKWLPPHAIGMIGLMMLGLGFLALWMEAAGYREADDPQVRKAIRKGAIKDSRAKTGPKPSAVKPVTNETPLPEPVENSPS